MLKCNFLTFFHTEIEFKSTEKILILINLWQYQPPDKHWVLSPSNFFKAFRICFYGTYYFQMTGHGAEKYGKIWLD